MGFKGPAIQKQTRNKRQSIGSGAFSVQKEEHMKILLPYGEYRKLLKRAAACYPEEACGLLGGRIDSEGNKQVEQVYLLTNTEHSRIHFTLDPKEQLAAVKDMRAQGWTLLGNWHSHPDTPSRPSAEDRRLAYDSRASYMILSLKDKEPVLRSFHIENQDAVTAEELVITGTDAEAAVPFQKEAE
jgi:proteasome lid subunit RPN8/RPN11